jgi:hypothetical protein
MPNSDFPLRKIISGGQTGADRAALDAALDAGFPCGGWCPKGRKAEDGRIPARYPMRETNSKSYADRTLLNIQDADGTLVITIGEPEGGTAYTLECAASERVLCLHIDAHQQPASAAAEQAVFWLRENHIAVLNVAGPRASKEPAIYVYVHDLMSHVLASF